MNTIKEILENVKDILDTPESWTQCNLAANAKNDKVEVLDPNACKWCLEGAVLRALNINHINYQKFHNVWDYVNMMSKERNGCHTIDFNDNVDTRHEDIIDFIDFLIYEI